jgi:hypothetical protein
MAEFKIKANMSHGAGAYARCSKCGTYSLDLLALADFYPDANKGT